MYTIWCVIDKDENGKYKSYSMTKSGAYIVSKENFNSHEEAKFFIKELSKPNYYKEFGSNYELIEIDPNSEELVNLFNDLEDVLDFIEKDTNTIKYKWHHLVHSFKETAKITYNSLFFSKTN